MPPTATTRRYIQRNTSSPSEPTTTLVLTSPSGLFVDIRVTSSSPHSPLPLPAVSRELVTPSSTSAKLDWAFSGRAETWTTEDGVHHCKWTHAADSETKDAESVEDEGIMEVKRERGVDGEQYEWEVESGTNTTDDGTINTYEEGWLAVPLVLHQDGKPFEAIPNAPSQAIRLTPCPSPPAADRHCVVLTVSPDIVNKAPYPQGLIIRIGDWCQGILRPSRDGDDFAVARWVRLHGKWEKLVEIGCEKESMEEMAGCLGRLPWETDGLAKHDWDGENKQRLKRVEDVEWMGVRWVVKEATSW